MKITATSSGGFAGITQRHEVDTAVSPDGPALEAALASQRFFDAPQASQAEPIGADLPRWTISVDSGGRQHSVSFTQGGGTAWEKLLARILAA